MPDTPTVPVDVKEIRLSVSGNLPGEQLLVKLLEYAITYRATMSQKNRDEYDELMLEGLRSWNKTWRSWGVLQ